ncbi:uncharacterized protein LOC112506823 isoform X2 [Cynara cardunculus var. scolymus]|uniref:uncharacterized protein LOC112506823 isoform X2 n=1 Tax=Cynara cardunculus var. scolymus TaxID=59895 RepID=UPI000D623970|nr:uncharacterized protein LOC112506823 isoform X2 [Cynara cardunculus var. scolymus]
MAANCSTAPTIQWNWVIEALANFEQVDTSTLIGLVKIAPAISGDLGKDAREVVSMRILESLFVHGNEAIVDGDSAQSTKISFDPSERCEHVLQQILNETPEPPAKLEKEKWDVLPFLMHKRSNLPKCMLKKLKEAILESSHPLLASLKERSRVITNVSENTSPGIDGNSNVQASVKDDLAFLNPRKDKNKFQEKVLQGADQVEKTAGGTAQHTGREECEMVIEPPLGGAAGKKMMDHDAHAASEALLHSCDVANAQHDQKQLHCNDDNLPQDTHREGHDEGVPVDSMENLEFVVKYKVPKNSTQPNALDGEPSSIAKNFMAHDGRLETSTDSERADDENTDIAAKKEAFLNSQCTLNQDSLAMTELSEINLCMKCNEGGQLLVCSSDACPLRVHESCLGSAVTLDENGEFFCPFCAYSRAISKYLKAKRKASLARKNLQAFSSFTVNSKPNKSCIKHSELEINEGREMGAFGETTNGNGNGDTVSRADNINRMSIKEDSTRADPLMPIVNDDPSCGEEEAVIASADNSVLPDLDKGVSVADQSMTEAEEVRQNVGEGCESPTRMEEHQLSPQAITDCGLKTPSFDGNEIDLVIGECADMQHIQTGCLTQQTTDLPQNPIPQPSTPKQKCKEKESHRSVESSCSRRLRKRKVQHTSSAVPLSRRKILPWTKSEEETLKEGVQRYSSVNNKGIPWKEILDFGCNVFHKGRTPIDLKDKWRNVCKGSPNLK